jgi:TolA-binding protein
LRQFHTKVSNLLGKNEIKPDEGLFGIGERYMENERYPHAKYIFNRYLDHYPEGKDAVNAEKNLHIAEIAIVQTAPEKTAPEDGGGRSEAATAYYNGINLINKEKFKDAMRMFARVSGEENPDWAAKCVFEIGRCFFFLNRFDDCINHFQDMLVQYPKHFDRKDAMFYIGQSCEKTGKNKIAVTWYKKIIAMPGSDTDGTRSKTLQALDLLEKPSWT